MVAELLADDRVVGRRRAMRDRGARARPRGRPRSPASGRAWSSTSRSSARKRGIVIASAASASSRASSRCCARSIAGTVSAERVWIRIVPGCGGIVRLVASDGDQELRARSSRALTSRQVAAEADLERRSRRRRSTPSCGVSWAARDWDLARAASRPAGLRSSACRRRGRATTAGTSRAHVVADRQRRHAVPRRLGHDGARTPRPRHPSRRAPDPAGASATPTGGCSDLAAAGRLGRAATLESFLYVEVDRETDPALLDGAARTISNACCDDVRVATTDWLKMLARLRHVVDELVAPAAAASTPTTRRGRALLRRGWPTSTSRSSAAAATTCRAEDGEDVCARCRVPGSACCAERAGTRPSRELRRAARPRSAPARASRRLLVLTKANRRSTVHRPTYLDYVGVRRFDDARRR